MPATNTLTAAPATEWMAGMVANISSAPAGVPTALWRAALVGPIGEFLTRPGKHFRSRLVHLAWNLAGRADEPPVQLPAIVELLHAGSLIVDDIQDGSVQRRGRAALHRLVGMPVALNAGNWLYFWPISLLEELEFAPEIELRLHRLIPAAVRRSHEGQALDLTARIGDLHPAEVRTVCRTISTWKTGSLMGLAAGLGATATGGTEEHIAAVTRFGEAVGIALQMQNDLSELTGSAGPLKHPEDLIQGRVTWPWAWAAERLGAGAFDALQVRGAKLAAGAGDAAKLAADLLAALGPDPRQPVRQELAAAYSDLTNVIGPHPALEAVRDELARLEQKYA